MQADHKGVRMKRNVQRPWGRKRNGGWIILQEDLVKALKDGDAIQVGEVTVGAKQLRQVISLVPCEDVLIRSNGSLEIETIERVIVRKPDNVKTSFRKPAHNWNYFRLFNNAWVPKVVKTLVVLKPRKY